MTSSGKSILSRLADSDAVLALYLRACALLVSLVMLLVLAYMTLAAWPMLQAPWRWMGSAQWHPLEHAYGLLSMLAATVCCSVLAMLLAVPLGMAVAVWGRFYASARMGAAYRGLMGVMSSTPSVVYGLWGLTVLVPLMARVAPPGASLLSGALVLAWMILPILMLQADLALEVAARRHLTPVLALGVSRWGAIRNVLLPASWPELGPALLLQGGRALGETMAMLMVCGNVVQWPLSVQLPVRTLTANIALEMAYASGAHQQALFASGWLLLLLVLLVMLGAAIWRSRGGHAGR